MDINKKAVSRERLIGISFIDILIQVIFLLFLALTILKARCLNPTEFKAYQENKENVKYAGVGKDLCNKTNRDSPTECREVLTPIVEKEFSKGSLSLCLKPINEKVMLSANFKVLSPKKIRFNQFTSAYKEYLEKHHDTNRLARIQSIKPGVYSTQSIHQVFGFIKEAGCRHAIQSYSWEGSWNQRQLQPAFKALNELSEFKK